MPYAQNEDLPPSVRHVLPSHAQDIYRAAFNNAYDRYGGNGERRAHRIAWAAVKRSYQKVGDVWVEKTSRASIPNVLFEITSTPAT